MEPIRVLHLVEAFGGGVFEVVKVLTGRLAQAGHHVAIAHGARSETPASARGEIDQAVEVFPLPWTRRTPGAQLAAARAMRRVVSGWRPDVVHLHSSFAGVLGAAVLGGGRLPLVYSPHAYSFTMRGHSAIRRRAYRALERFVAQRTTVIGAVSASEGRLARDEVGAGRVVVVENGIRELDTPPARRSVAPERPSVVAAGRVTEQRRPEACARILGQVRDLADVGWIGGGSPQSEGVAALDRANVPMTGWVPRAEALARLGEATVYLHWTAWDGQPLSVLEAMAEDVVVVASAIEPNRDLLGAGQTFADEGEAVAAIRRVVGDGAERARLLDRQRERAAHFGSERMARRWEAVYRSLVDEAAGALGRERAFMAALA